MKKLFVCIAASMIWIGCNEVSEKYDIAELPCDVDTFENQCYKDGAGILMCFDGLTAVRPCGANQACRPVAEGVACTESPTAGTSCDASFVNYCLFGKVMECVGGKVSERLCADGQACKDGRCVSASGKCDMSSFVPGCEGTKRTSCVENEVRYFDCASENKACKDGRCVSASERCDMSSFVPVCEGTKRTSCVENEVKYFDCASEDKACKDGRCVSASERCDMSSFVPVCEGTKRTSCVENEVKYFDCASEDKACKDGLCVDKCDNSFAPACVGTVLKTCVNDKVESFDCASQDKGCEDNQCVEKCKSGTDSAKCTADGKGIATCSASGHFIPKACDAVIGIGGSVCKSIAGVEDRCFAPVEGCSIEGGARCEGDTLISCDENGATLIRDCSHEQAVCADYRGAVDCYRTCESHNCRLIEGDGWTPDSYEPTLCVDSDDAKKIKLTFTDGMTNEACDDKAGAFRCTAAGAPESVQTICRESQKCVVEKNKTGYSAKCVEKEVETCDDEGQLSCEGNKVVACKNGIKTLLKTCGDDSVCFTAGTTACYKTCENEGKAWRNNRYETCETVDGQKIVTKSLHSFCDGNYLVRFSGGQETREDCGTGTCVADIDADSASCKTTPSTCSQEGELTCSYSSIYRCTMVNGQLINLKASSGGFCDPETGRLRFCGKGADGKYMPFDYDCGSHNGQCRVDVDNKAYCTCGDLSKAQKCDETSSVRLSCDVNKGWMKKDFCSSAICVPGKGKVYCASACNPEKEAYKCNISGVLLKCVQRGENYYFEEIGNTCEEDVARTCRDEKVVETKCSAQGAFCGTKSCIFPPCEGDIKSKCLSATSLIKCDAGKLYRSDCSALGREAEGGDVVGSVGTCEFINEKEGSQCVETCNKRAEDHINVTDKGLCKDAGLQEYCDGGKIKEKNCAFGWICKIIGEESDFRYGTCAPPDPVP